MSRIEVSTVIDAGVDEVWAVVEDIARHVDWMLDAESIRFTSTARQGVGTTFECVTKIGPVRLTDRMEVTEWSPGRAMGVRHAGVVKGEGRFTLEPAGPGRARFGWEEALVFPLFMGGPVGATVAAPALKQLWAANLRRLKRLIEDQGTASRASPSPPAY
ncbi:MAG: SRPBCC family protein [Acidimicrobiia bacterium]